MQQDLLNIKCLKCTIFFIFIFFWIYPQNKSNLFAFLQKKKWYFPKKIIWIIEDCLNRKPLDDKSSVLINMFSLPLDLGIRQITCWHRHIYKTSCKTLFIRYKYKIFWLKNFTDNTWYDIIGRWEKK